MTAPATMRIAGNHDRSLSRRLAFNVKALDKIVCPPGKDRAWSYDTRQAGLCLMSTVAGQKSFYVYRKVNGRPQRIRLGGFPEITIEQARNLAKRQIGEIAKGVDPMAARRD